MPLILLFALINANDSLELTVLTSNGQPASGVEVRLEPDGTATSSVHTGPDGKATIANDPRPRRVYLATDAVLLAYPIAENDRERVLRIPELAEAGGRVTNLAGDPIRGVDVFLQGTGQIAGDRYSHSAAATTDVGGVWSAAIPGGSDNVWIRFVHPEYVATSTSLDINGTGLPETSTYATVLQRGSTVRFRVLSPGGEPIEGAGVATIGLLQHRGRADGNGVVSFTAEDGRPTRFAAGRVNVVAVAGGYAPTFSELQLEEGVNVDSDLRMNLGESTSIVVMGPNDLPIQDALVSFFDPYEWGDADLGGTTDVGGVWSWDRCPPSISVRVSAKGFADATISLRPSAEPIEVRLKPRLLADIRVLDAETADPVAAPSIVVQRSSEASGYNWFPAGQTEAGVFEPDSDAEYFRFLVSAPGYATTLSPTVPGNSEARTIEIRLRRADNSRITVLNPQGRPASDAEVCIAVDGTAIAIPAGDGHLPNAVRTTADGVCKIAAWDAPHHIVARTADGFAIVSHTDVASDPVLTLTPWTRVEGTAMYGDVPAGGGRVSLTLVDMPRTGPVPFRFDKSVTADAEGTFSFARLPAGRIALKLNYTAPDGSTFSGPIIRTNATAGAVTDIRLPNRGSVIRGRVLFDEGVRPNASAQELTLERRNLKPGDVIDTYRFTLAANGEFTIPDVPFGRHRLRLTVFDPPYDAHGYPVDRSGRHEDVRDVTIRSTGGTVDLGKIDLRTGTGG